MTESSRVIRSKGFRWKGVPVKDYALRSPKPLGVTRQVIFGADDVSLPFEMRYFEVEPGSATALDQHAHAHAVIIMDGRGVVQLADRVEHVQPYDCVYVAPNDVHQFRAADDEGLGFLCIVDRDRHARSD